MNAAIFSPKTRKLQKSELYLFLNMYMIKTQEDAESIDELQSKMSLYSIYTNIVGKFIKSVYSLSREVL